MLFARNFLTFEEIETNDENAFIIYIDNNVEKMQRLHLVFLVRLLFLILHVLWKLLVEKRGEERNVEGIYVGGSFRCGI